MDGGDAICAVGADDRQIGHPNLVLVAFLDQADAGHAGLVAGIPMAHVGEEPAIDLEDDFELPRQQPLEIMQRPFLQRLGQQRVVGVGQRPAREIPGLLPLQVRLIEQDAHQLGHRQGGMGVVELDRDLVGKRAPVGVVAAESPHEVGQRAGNQEILLREAQPLSLFRGVVGIKHARQRIRRDAANDGADEIPAAELLKVELVMGCGAPEPQGVDGLAAEADDGTVERNADQGRGATRYQLQAPAGDPDGAPELDLHRVAGTGHLPWILATQPVVGMLTLPAVLDGLPEHAVFVAQAVSHRRKLHGRH